MPDVSRSATNTGIVQRAQGLLEVRALTEKMTQNRDEFYVSNVTSSIWRALLLSFSFAFSVALMFVPSASYVYYAVNIYVQVCHTVRGRGYIYVVRFQTQFEPSCLLP